MEKMMLEWYAYFPTSLMRSQIETRESLPASIVAELVQTPDVFKRLVAVDAEKGDIVKQLDARLQIGSSTEYLRAHEVEVTTNELATFSYYRIRPQILDHGKDMFVDIEAPQCDKCSWGARFRGPVSLREATDRSCDFGEVQRSHRLDIELIVSERIRHAFKKEGITGLTYHAIPGSSSCMATMASSSWRKADAVVSEIGCTEHCVVVAPVVINPTTPVGEFMHDFEIVRGVQVGDTRLTYHPPEWFVSRRTLELLLREVKRLRRATTRLNQKFKPCLKE